MKDSVRRVELDRLEPWQRETHLRLEIGPRAIRKIIHDQEAALQKVRTEILGIRLSQLPVTRLRQVGYWVLVQFRIAETVYVPANYARQHFRHFGQHARDVLFGTRVIVRPAERAVAFVPAAPPPTKTTAIPLVLQPHPDELPVVIRVSTLLNNGRRGSGVADRGSMIGDRG